MDETHPECNCFAWAKIVGARVIQFNAMVVRAVYVCCAPMYILSFTPLWCPSRQISLNLFE